MRFAFIIELATRRVVRVAVTRYPTDALVAPQRREATPERKACAGHVAHPPGKAAPLASRYQGRHVQQAPSELLQSRG